MRAPGQFLRNAVFVFAVAAAVCGGAAWSVEVAPSPEAPIAGPTVDLKTDFTVPSTGSGKVKPPAIAAAAAVLMDADTGLVLYSRLPHKRLPNASTTKILTSVLLLEHCDLDELICASKKASLTPYTSIHLQPGEQISARDLLAAMMIRSANDAAVAAAEHVGGTVTAFADMLNEKAAQIGCTNTHFVTPNGLHHKDHYSSAYDLCLMARYAFQYPEFNQMTRTRKYFLNSRTVNREDLVVFSKSNFMKYFPGADGVKTGYVKQAKYCFVGSATKGKWRLVSAVLGSDNAARDTTALMSFGFTNYVPFVVAKADTIYARAPVKGSSSPTVGAVPVRDLAVVVPRAGARVAAELFLDRNEAPIAKGEHLGTLRVNVDGKPAGSVDLQAVEDVPAGLLHGARIDRKWLLTAVGVGCLLMAGRIYGTTAAKNSRRRRRRFSSSLRNTYDGRTRRR